MPYTVQKTKSKNKGLDLFLGILLSLVLDKFVSDNKHESIFGDVVCKPSLANINQLIYVNNSYLLPYLLSY